MLALMNHVPKLEDLRQETLIAMITMYALQTLAIMLLDVSTHLSLVPLALVLLVPL